MFTSKIVDKTDEFLKSLNDIRDQSRIQSIVGEEITPLAQQMLRNLVGEAPEGSRWEEPSYEGTSAREPIIISHGRPSMRLHGMMLESGWGQPEVDEISDGAKFEIRSNAPQIVFLLDGSDRHPMSGNPLLSFWHFGSGQAMVMSALPNDHPGHEPSDFVEVSHEKLQPDVSIAMNSVVQKITKPIHRLQ